MTADAPASLPERLRAEKGLVIGFPTAQNAIRNRSALLYLDLVVHPDHAGDPLRHLCRL